jgi:hypothetical protein
VALAAACRSEPKPPAGGLQDLGAAMGAMGGALTQQQRCAREASEPISLRQAMETDAAQARAALAQPVLRRASHEATRVLAELGRRTPRPALPWKVLVVEGARATFTPLPMGTVVLTRAALRGLADEAELAAVLGYAAVLISHDRLDPSLAQQRERACKSAALSAALGREPGVSQLFPSDGGLDGERIARDLMAQLDLTVDPADRLAILAQVAPLLSEAGYALRALQTVPQHATALFAAPGLLPAPGDWSATAAEAMQGLGPAAFTGALPALEPALAEAAGQP